MQHKNFISNNNRSSINIINSVINDLIVQSKNQILSNQTISKCMSPFTSQKVNATINQIGKLIYQEAQDSQISKKFDHFKELQEPEYFQRDNMFVNGVLIDYDQIDEGSKLKVDDSQSVNSYQTLSKSQLHMPIAEMPDKHKDSKKQLKSISVKKRQQTQSKSTQLISLEPQSSNQSRTSAFNRSQTQNIEKRLLEIQINQFRDQKILQDEEKKKIIQKEKKMTHLLANDEVVMTFDYDGEFIKKSKRQLSLMIENRAKRNVVETGLLINDEKFWKSKKPNQKPNQKSQLELSSFIANDSNIKNLMKSKGINNKITTMQKIEELKKRSVQIETKKKINASGTDQKQKRLESAFSKGFQFNSISNNDQKLTQEEQTKMKEHQMDFLSKRLQTYHEKQQNYMPEWIQIVEKGCKMTIYVGNGEQDKTNDKQKKFMEKKTNRSFSDRSQITSIKNENPERESPKPKKSKQNGRFGNLAEVKHLQNLKPVEITDEEMVEEWQKRRYLKSVGNKQALGNSKVKKTSKTNLENSRKISLNENKQFSRNNTEKSVLLQVQKDKYEDDSKSEYSFSQANHEKYTKINLNKYEFDKLKKYLKNKNSIVKRNETLKNDGMEFFLIKESKPKPSAIIPVENQAKSEHKMSLPTNHTVEASSNVFTKEKLSQNPINQEEEVSTINQKRNSQKHRRLYTLAWKPRSFSVAERRQSTCKSQVKSKIKDKIDGSIKINNEKLKHSLLRESIDFDLSKSSILNSNQVSKSKLKSSSSEIKWELTQKSRIKSIGKSEKRLLPINSNAKGSTLTENLQSINIKQLQGSVVSKETAKTKSTLIVVNKQKTSVLKANLLNKPIK